MQKNLEAIRHSLSHVMAMSVLKQFPKAKLGIGPVIENGFYYDFELDRPLTPQDVKKIEKQMKKYLSQNLEFTKEEVSVAKAKKMLKSEPYKLELLEDIKKPSFYSSGEFTDLCAGPHVKSTKEINLKAFKLMNVAGAYWRGDEKNKMLQRIYGVAFETREELDHHLKMLEEAEKRDHKKLGQELGLFTFSEHGPGFPIFLNNGLVIWEELLKYWRQVHRKYDYQEIKTPMMFNKSLWKISGHWDYYRENMYTSKIEDQDFVIKPMNCPGGMLAYKNEMHSYKELPLKVAEIGQVHRYERSGTLNGLLRVREFHQDDAHIYMTDDQVVDQVKEVLKIADEMYSTFGLKYHLELSTQPEKYIGTDAAWKKSTKALKDALKGKEFKINEGDGAFYGPKIDVHLEDALGRTWQCATIQVDMSLPERFDLTYIDAKGKKKRPIMVHRTVLGSVERFLGVLIEHYAGAFPVWLSPVQISLIPVGEKHIKHCEKLAEELSQFRVSIDKADETVGNKIRKAVKQKSPYMLVIGDKEMASKDLMVRARGEQEAKKISKKKFVEQLEKEIKERK